MKVGDTKKGWKIVKMKKLKDDEYRFTFRHKCGKLETDEGYKEKIRKIVKPGELYCCTSTSSTFNSADHYHYPVDFPDRCYKCSPTEVCPTCGHSEDDYY